MFDHVEGPEPVRRAPSPTSSSSTHRSAVMPRTSRARLAKASERVSAALAAASEAGVAAADRQSTGMGVNSRWDHEGRGVIGYSAYQSLRLLVRDRDGVGDLISALARAARRLLRAGRRAPQESRRRYIKPKREKKKIFHTVIIPRIDI